jgi:F0F1-type ATP synthase beta subunit
VVQRRGDGVVRGIVTSPADALPRGSTVLNSGRHVLAPIGAAEFAGVVRSLAGPAPDGQVKLLETGIKVIDVMCPLVAGGTLAIAGDLGAGIWVVMEELVRRVSPGRDRLTMFIMMPAPSPEWPASLDPGFSHAEAFKKDGFSEGTVGAMQTFFFRAPDGPWTAERLAMLAPADTVIRLSRARGRAKVYPTVDVMASRSRLLEPTALGEEHAAIAERVRQALAALWANPAVAPVAEPTLTRALKLQNYFTQPFYCAEPYTGRPGATVAAAEALHTCRDILDGRYDDLPVEAFYFSGDTTEITGNIGRVLTFGPVTTTT